MAKKPQAKKPVGRFFKAPLRTFISVGRKGFHFHEEIVEIPKGDIADAVARGLRVTELTLNQVKKLKRDAKRDAEIDAEVPVGNVEDDAEEISDEDEEEAAATELEAKEKEEADESPLDDDSGDEDLDDDSDDDAKEVSEEPKKGKK